MALVHAMDPSRPEAVLGQRSPESCGATAAGFSLRLVMDVDGWWWIVMDCGGLWWMVIVKLFV